MNAAKYISMQNAYLSKFKEFYKLYLKAVHKSIKDGVIKWKV
jgi:hypothetical protein